MKSRRRLSFMAACVLASAPAISSTRASDALDHWFWRNPLPQGNQLSAVAFGGDQYVAVGIFGTIVSSGDGLNWTLQNTGTTNHWTDIAYGNGRFVAVSLTGQSALVSSNGINWTTSKAGQLIPGMGIAFGSGLFVAVGGDITGSREYIATSPDGVNWTLQGIELRDSEFRDVAYFSDVAYGNGRYVAVSYGCAVVSSDGVKWTPHQTGHANGPNAVTFGNGLFVGVGRIISTEPDKPNVFRSTDGIEWSAGRIDTPETLNSVAFGRGEFVAVGNSGAPFTSKESLKWEKKSVPVPFGLGGVTYGENGFVAVGAGGTILHSQDGSAWTRQTRGAKGGFRDVVYAAGRFVAVGEESFDGPGVTARSFDGINWEVLQQGENILWAVTYALNQFVAVGDRGTILTSADGANWMAQDSGIAKTLRAITFAENRFVAVGDSGGILTSTSGTDWKQEVSGVTYGLTSVAYGADQFIAVGGSNVMLLTSPDGITWQLNGFVANGAPTAIAYGAGLWVIVGRSGLIITSSDGENWTRLFEVPSHLWAVKHSPEGFIAAGWGTILTSTGGKIWKRRVLPTINTLYGIAPGRNSVIALGGATILQSAPLQGGILGNPRIAGGNLEFFVATGTNAFRLESTSDLSSPKWIDLGPVTNQTISVRIDTAAEHEFFRAVPER